MFASAGLVSAAEFDTALEARKSADRFGSVKPPAGITVTELVADDWLANSRIKLKHVASREMKNWLDTGLFPDNAVSFVGVFMGVEPDGTLAAVSESVYCRKPVSDSNLGCDASENGSLLPLALGLLGKVVYRIPQNMDFVPFGIRDVALQIINDDGRVAARENIQWRNESTEYPATHTDAYRAIRLVDLTIAYSQISVPIFLE